MKNESRRVIGGFFCFSAFFTKMLAGLEKVRILQRQNPPRNKTANQSFFYVFCNFFVLSPYYYKSFKH